MRVVKSPVPASQWAAILGNVTDQVPPGFQTMEQIARETGLSVQYASNRLRPLIRAGLVEVRKFRLPGHPYPVPHYKNNHEKNQPRQNQAHRRHR